MPIIQSGVTVWTYSDAVQAVLDAFDIQRDGLNERRARQAVLQAYRDLPQHHTWSYYYRQRLLQTVAQQTSSTITYDHTGGSSERLVTLASGTWPSWAEFGRLVIADVHYDIDRRLSDTTLTLSETSNPGADVAAGTSYTLYRSSYPLPSNFKNLNTLWDVEQQRRVEFVDQVQHYAALQVFYDTPDIPWQATVRSTGKYLGLKEIIFGPPPSEARTYDLLYQVFPRALSIDDYSSVTVSTTASDATVTGATGVTFPTNCVGSLIRFSAGATKPSSLLGNQDGNDNPFVTQGIIKERISDTVVELEEAADQTLTNVGYTISDPLDIESGSMFTAFLRAAEAEFARLRGTKDAESRALHATRALRIAIENDKDFDHPQRGLAYNPYKYTTSTDD